ncbi:hypothetical protein GOODEAATRI_029462 [Goodea atripinnis]|uniref:Uncharacterized protein n=1 Tax=Goodea atripinnis TaxID=208336 RepID=A0ABV0PIC7_9TELE
MVKGLYLYSTFLVFPTTQSAFTLQVNNSPLETHTLVPGTSMQGASSPGRPKPIRTTLPAEPQLPPLDVYITSTKRAQVPYRFGIFAVSKSLEIRKLMILQHIYLIILGCIGLKVILEFQ